MPAAVDDFALNAPDLNGPATHAETVTPSDTVDLAKVSRFLYVGGAGALTVITALGETVTFPAVITGWIPIRASRVKATGTTATNIVSMS